MKKTEFQFCVGITNSGSIWRRVWEKDGEFFIKHHGKTLNVTDESNKFYKF